MQKLTVYTDLDTVSDAYTILDELGLSGLIVSKKLDIDLENLLRDILAGQNLKRFISIITNTPFHELPKLTGKDCTELITSFFVGLVSDWMSLAGLALQAQATPEQTK